MRQTRRSLRPPAAAIPASLCASLAASASGQWSPAFDGNGPDGTVSALLVGPGSQGSQLFAAGSFAGVTTPAGPLASANIAAWDGHTWQPGPGMPNAINALAVHPVSGQPTLFAGASTTTFGQPPLWRLTGGAWVGVPVGTQVFVSGLASYDLGQGPRLAISSTFFEPSSYIAYWDNGTLGPIGNGLITVTNAFAVFDDGQGPRLYAGAGPNSVPSLTFLGRFDGNDWAVPSGGGTGSTVYALQVFDDGSGPALYVGGDFQWVGTNITQCGRIARYKNGAWSVLGSGLNNTVRAMTVFDDGSGPALYVAGDFTTAGGQPASRIARWRGGQWSALGAGITGGSVLTLAVFDDDGPGPVPPALYAGGSFTTAGGMAARHMARWGTLACYANCDASTTAPVLNVLDFACFLNRFAGGDAYANCDGSTTDPVLNVLDFACFLNRFAAGCP
jgi:hypothetical protein